ncbi:hypothetical protein P3X46_032094 [Hevea brasiliensis]|uniref:Potassium transporter n=1 Tax=Hevea brasiliensis TaxID=3981 RepID=A0ABQ9KN23_HEVBR|nr:hypothetical protein P3X46_032094 [Hevea brasiliensis]
MDPAGSPDTYPGRLEETWRHTLILSFQSLEVVYGLLSTAPLYVFGTIPTDDFQSDETAYECFSFIFWTLTIISFLKYAFIILRADDNGEGGTFALHSLLSRHPKVGLLPDDRNTNERAFDKHKSSHYLMLFLALFGACMLIGDAVLTPSISVLSASSDSSSPQTQRSLSDAIERYVPVAFACAILACLFILQHYGTRKIGFIFAPIVTIWLLLISGVDIYNTFHFNPKILGAISPVCMYKFVRSIDKRSWRSLGSILLCVAGSEAMFADLGHFSKKSIQVTKYQATITASFSIINHCLALGCFPRVKVIHTSNNHHGQVYIPDVNWLLMVLSLTVTIGFHDLHRIATAVGLAIVSGMVVATYLMSLVIALHWEKTLLLSGCSVIFWIFAPDLEFQECPGIPAFFSHFVTNLPAFHQVLIFVSFKSLPVHYVPPCERYLVGRIGAKGYKIYRCIVRCGYCDQIRDTDDFEEQIIRSIGEFISLEENDSEKKVRFILPENTPKMLVSVREELQELINGSTTLSLRDDSTFIKKYLIMTYVFLDKNCREPPVALNIPHAALVEVCMAYTI